MTPEQIAKWDDLQKQAAVHNLELMRLGNEAKELLQVTPDEWEEAWNMANEGYRECGSDFPDPGSPDGIWSMLDEVVLIREDKEENEKESLS